MTSFRNGEVSGRSVHIATGVCFASRNPDNLVGALAGARRLLEAD
jgi:hypothetical protein